MIRILIVSFAFISVLFASTFSIAVKNFKQGNYEKAKKMFELAYEEDSIPAAAYFLGLIYLDGLGETKKDLKKAQKFLETAAAYGNLRAECALAKLYIEKKHFDKARKIIRTNPTAECQELQIKLSSKGSTK